MILDTEKTEQCERCGVADKAASSSVESAQKSAELVLSTSGANRTAAALPSLEAPIACGGMSTLSQAALTPQKSVSRDTNKERETQGQGQLSSKRSPKHRYPVEDCSTCTGQALGQNFVLTAKSYTSEELEKEVETILTQQTEEKLLRESGQRTAATRKSEVESVQRATKRWAAVLLTGQISGVTGVKQINHPLSQ